MAHYEVIYDIIEGEGIAQGHVCQIFGADNNEAALIQARLMRPTAEILSLKRKAPTPAGGKFWQRENKQEDEYIILHREELPKNIPLSDFKD